MSGANLVSVVQLLTTVLANDPFFQKCSLKLNQKNVLFLNELLKKSPNELEEFAHLFSEITEDGKIDMSDVPKVLLMLKTMYEMAMKFKVQKITVEDVVELTQFILTELGQVKGVNKKTLNQILVIVDSASDLLTLTGVNKKTVVGISGFFRKLF